MLPSLQFCALVYLLSYSVRCEKSTKRTNRLHATRDVQIKLLDHVCTDEFAYSIGSSDNSTSSWEAKWAELVCRGLATSPEDIYGPAAGKVFRDLVLQKSSQGPQILKLAKALMNTGLLQEAKAAFHGAFKFLPELERTSPMTAAELFFEFAVLQGKLGDAPEAQAESLLSSIRVFASPTAHLRLSIILAKVS